MSIKEELNKLANKELSDKEIEKAIDNLVGFLNTIIKIHDNLSEEERNTIPPILESKYEPYMIDEQNVRML